MKTKSITKTFAVLVALATGCLAYCQTPAPEPDWGWCSWVDRVDPVTEGDYQVRWREKRTYERKILKDPGCCPSGTAPAPQTGSVSYQVKHTRTWSRSGKVSGVLNFIWNILTGSPWEATGSKSETTETTETVTDNISVSCGQKGMIYEVKTEQDKFEYNKDASSNKTETRTDYITSYGLASKIIGTNDEFDPCTGIVTPGDPCPPVEPDIIPGLE